MVAAKKGCFSADWLLLLQDAAKPCLISREMASLESSQTVSASTIPRQSGLCPPRRGCPNNQSLHTDMHSSGLLRPQQSGHRPDCLGMAQEGTSVGANSSDTATGPAELMKVI